MTLHIFLTFPEGSTFQAFQISQPPAGHPKSKKGIRKKGQEFQGGGGLGPIWNPPLTASAVRDPWRRVTARESQEDPAGQEGQEECWGCPMQVSFLCSSLVNRIQ